MVQWVIWLIPHGGLNELFFIPASTSHGYNKGHGVFYPVCGIKRSFAAYWKKNSLCGGSSGFHLLLFEWSFTRHHITINKMCWMCSYLPSLPFCPYPLSNLHSQFKCLSIQSEIEHESQNEIILKLPWWFNTEHLSKDDFTLRHWCCILLNTISPLSEIILSKLPKFENVQCNLFLSKFF